MACKLPCPNGSQCYSGSVFGNRECAVVRTLTRPFRLQLQTGQGRQQCLISVAAPQSGGWSLDAVRIRFNDIFQSCRPYAGSTGLFSVRASLRNSGTKQVYSTASKDTRAIDGDLDPMYLTATNNGKRTKVSSGQVVLDMAYSIAFPSSCVSPDHFEGTLIVDFLYVVYNTPPGGAPGSMRSSGGCLDPGIPAGKCNWWVPSTYCDCTGWATPLNVPGFGNLGCDTAMFMLGGGALLVLFLFLELR